MTLNTEIWGFMDFGAAKHISRANSAEITKSRPGQPVYKIFSINRRLQRFKSRLPVFKEACAWKHQREVPL